MDKNRLKGTFTALVTPFRDGEVNYADLEAHVDTMYGLMREYDHVASDSEFSDESESEDENEKF